MRHHTVLLSHPLSSITFQPSHPPSNRHPSHLLSLCLFLHPSHPTHHPLHSSIGYVVLLTFAANGDAGAFPARGLTTTVDPAGELRGELADAPETKEDKEERSERGR